MNRITHKTDEGWVYEDCEVVRVIDGDTVIMKVTAEVVVEVDFGFKIKDRMILQKEAEVIVRLADVNTPEIRGVQKPQGLISKAVVEDMLASGKIRVVTYKEGKYGGRWIGSLYITQAGGGEIELSGWLIENNYGAPYRIR
jgi:endonuclease YncB( thermonuclease family)